MKKIFNDYLESLLVYNMSKKTVSSYQKRINGFLEFNNVNTIEEFNLITLTELEKYLFHLGEIGNSASTKQNKITAINSFYEYLISHNLSVDNPCCKLKKIQLPQKEQSFLTEDESLKMIDLKNTHCKRTSAIIALCLQCGLRISEVINLKKDNIYLENNKWNIIIKNAKGNKERIVYLDEHTKEIIDDYMVIRKENNQYDNVFISNYNNPMNECCINNTIKKVAKSAGINKNITIHSLRRSMATRLNEKEVPLNYIQKLLGHASYNTTLRYVKTDQNKVSQSAISSSLEYEK